ncbi:hypothetical protein ABV23_RS00100 [Escherichia coli]|nr:hypothetical protein [Escherichia coli]
MKYSLYSRGKFLEKFIEDCVAALSLIREGEYIKVNHTVLRDLNFFLSGDLNNDMHFTITHNHKDIIEINTQQRHIKEYTRLRNTKTKRVVIKKGDVELMCKDSTAIDISTYFDNEEDMDCDCFQKSLIIDDPYVLYGAVLAPFCQKNLPDGCTVELNLTELMNDDIFEYMSTNSKAMIEHIKAIQC